MGLLKKAENEAAYLKAGFFGFPGSGKTRTSSEFAMGLAELEKVKQIAFFDTESGSDYMVPIFKEKGFELLVHKGRAFKDLLAVIRECEKEGIKILVIDSISHVWKELCDSYLKRLNRKRLEVWDWGPLKAEWQQFSDLYLNSPIHILMNGRAGYEYETEKNEDTGKNEVHKSGTKMKVESEMGFEPSFLIEMELIEDKKTGKLINRAYIIKDRTDKMNGKFIDYPTFKDISPVIQFLNIGGVHKGVDTTRNSQDMFENPDYSWAEIKKQKEIALEELNSLLTKHDLGGTSDKAKKGRIELLEEVFGTSSKTAIESMRLSDLQAGLVKIKYKFEPKTEHDKHVEESVKQAAESF